MVLVCVCLVMVVRAQEEEGEQKSSGPKRPTFKEPEMPSGDVYLVETFSDEEAVWKRHAVCAVCVLCICMYICTCAFNWSKLSCSSW